MEPLSQWETLEHVLVHVIHKNGPLAFTYIGYPASIQ